MTVFTAPNVAKEQGRRAEQRRRQLLALMAEQGWQALLVYAPAWRRDYLRYVSDLNLIGPYGLALLNLEGVLHLYLPLPWDRQRAREESWATEVICSADAVAAAADTLSRWVPRGRVGVANLELLEESYLIQLRRSCPGVAFCSATAAIERLRRIKDAEEIARLRQAAALADEGFRVMLEHSRVGRREFELVAEVEGFLRAQGCEDNFMLIASGGVEVTGMRAPTSRPLQPGDSITSELTPQVQGYYAQLCRTIVVGEPTAAQEKAFSIFDRAQQGALRCLRPGVTISQVAEAQNRVFAEEGFGQYVSKQYTRARGHGLGLHFDEPPLIWEGNEEVVEEGMVLIAHPNTYLPLSGYMVLGDTLLVTGQGCESLNRTPRRLFTVAGR